ncbi:hypothetical protein O181_067570 [Austropuccinia psidii MF-1]|uniref:Uncharacterized protein n=1 Tax=Austropuccinia psidii MF-1 TaxID=1389203 RepID=A0A9Q3EZ86_9BASI|nr:hypothetical protein [Austropuccinia psidii MF-1]
MRQEHGKHDVLWLKSEIIPKGANNSWRFKIKNNFENSIFNLEKDKPHYWFLRQKDRLSALHPDISVSMINMKIIRKGGGELENAIKRRCVEACSEEEYINEMEDVITRTRIGKTCTRDPMESQMIPNTFKEEGRPEGPVFKCHKYGRTSHLANTCTKNAKINEVQVIKEEEESEKDSEISDDTPEEDYPLGQIRLQVKEV